MSGIGIANKATQKITRDELKKVMKVARGDVPADLLIKNISVLDVIGGEISQSAIVISDGTIAGVGPEYNDASAHEIIDGSGKFAVPGFIDAHLHIESSMMHPFEFEKVTLPLGVTSIVCDPHEITNVLLDEGYSWFLRCSKLARQNMFVQMSSCVPALNGFETNRGEYKLEEMISHRDHEHVLGLAEMMNFPGVINGDDSVLDKIEAFSDMNLDGHCPLAHGKDLNAYIAAGIQNCHETVTIDEAKEKLSKGMSLLIREGTVAKNLNSLAPVINEFTSSECAICTDDRNPYEIFHEGHINYMIKEMINTHQIPVHVAYRVASYSAAKHFGLKRLGLIAPGRQADIVILNDLKSVDIQDVLIKGQAISKMDLDSIAKENLKISNPPLQKSINRKKVSQSDFKIHLESGAYNVIEIIPEEIITKHITANYDGRKFTEKDILKISVVERYGNESPIFSGLVKGVNLKGGAIASSVSHDCHNLIVIGDNDSDMTIAINDLIESGGGMCVVKNGKTQSLLPLSIAGLMSTQSAEVISQQITELKSAYKSIGGTLDEPFLQMAFLALPVIPTLKITDKGLFDVMKFNFISLRNDE